MDGIDGKVFNRTERRSRDRQMRKARVPHPNIVFRNLLGALHQAEAHGDDKRSREIVEEMKRYKKFYAEHWGFDFEGDEAGELPARGSELLADTGP